MRSSDVKSIPFVARAQYFALWVGLGTIRLAGLAGRGSSVQKRNAEGVAVKLHELGFVFKMSAMGLASAPFRFIGGRPRTSSIVRTKLIVLYCAETSAPCFT